MPSLRLQLFSMGTLALLLTCMSCQKLESGVVREIEFPEHDPRLAVTMFVSPGDTVLYASVYQSAGVLTLGGSAPLRDATLTLRQGEVVLVQGDSTHWREADPWNAWNSGPFMEMPLPNALILEEGLLSLEVDASPHFEPMSLLQPLPTRPVVESTFEAFADSVDEGWGYAVYYHRLTVDLDNRPGERDDYLIQLQFRDTELGKDWYNVGDLSYPDPRVGYNSGCSCWMAQDNGSDNVSMENLAFDIPSGEYEEDISEWAGEYRLVVQRPTGDLVRYFDSVDAYENASGNPFAEPTSIQGNIPDGFGVFGVTNKVVVTIP